MSLLKEALDAGKFGITAEMAPPKGCDFTEQMEAAELLKGKVHGVNVTDMQSACLKATGLGLCIKLKQAGCEPIIQMTGRDRNRMAIMGDALAAAAFGIDSMLALTGDHPVCAGGDCKDAKPVYDLDSVGILRMLSKMEETGRDCGGNPLAGNAVDKESGEITDANLRGLVGSRKLFPCCFGSALKQQGIDRLLELLAKADNMTDLLQIEQRLTEVRTELENVASRLRLYDNLVDFGTIEISISEVQKLTPVQEPGFFNRIGSGFMESLRNLWTFLKELAIFLVVASPYLVTIGAVAFVIVLIIRLSIRKKRAKKKKKQPPFNTEVKE